MRLTGRHMGLRGCAGLVASGGAPEVVGLSPAGREEGAFVSATAWCGAATVADVDVDDAAAGV